MSDAVPRRRSIESARKEAKQWLRALRGSNDDSGSGVESETQHGVKRDTTRDADSDSTMRTAHERLARVLNPVPEKPTLRDVQHALARESGYAGWTEFKNSISPDTPTVRTALQQFEVKAQALLDAYRLGTPEALERHYSLTWHRRPWAAMRSYIQLDLGKRPINEDDDVEITLDDAHYLIAIEHDFESWDDLQEFVEQLPAGFAVTASPVRVRASSNEDAPQLISSREWGKVLELLAQHPGATLDANGQMTDEMLAQAARIPHLAALRLGNCKTLSDEGIRHLAKLPNLRELDLSHTRVTDDGLKVLHQLPNLQVLNLVMTSVTDAGMVHLNHCHALQRLHLMWTRTGDGALRALAGKEQFTHLWSGNNVTDAGLAYLREIPAFTKWRGGEMHFGILAKEVAPNQLSLRGSITDRGVAQLRGLDGLCVLHLDDCALSDAASALEPLVSLPHLAKLGTDPKNAWMSTIARMPALRFLGMQDAGIDEDAYEDLSRSQSIEYIWGRRSHGVGSRAFRALGRMPSLRGMSVSCLNVDDSAIATLPDFPALRELMPMDIPDAGYRHIGKCSELEQLLLMYCRDTTDAATEHVTGLLKLRRYFNSYTTITDRTPQLLSGMDSLELITFDACNNLTNGGVAALARLPNLRELRVAGNALTPEVRNAFPPRITVHYSH